MIEAKKHPPVPERFRERFVTDGWRGIERYYGARTEVMLQWIAECGGLAILKAERSDYRKRRAQDSGLTVDEYCRQQREKNMEEDAAIWREQERQELALDAERRRYRESLRTGQVVA